MAPMAPINAAIGAKPAGTGALAYTDEPERLFRDAGFDVPAARPVSPAPSSEAPTAVPAKPGSMFEAAGFTLPTGRPEPAPQSAGQLGPDAPPSATGYVEMPGGGRHYIDANGNFLSTAATNPQQPATAQQLGGYLSALPGRVGSAIGESYSGATGLMGEGFNDLKSGLYARALGKLGLGALGIPGSIVAGPTNVAAEEIDKLTGVPGTGEKVALLGPGMLAGKLANATRPTVSALSALIKDIGPENLPAVVNRLRANPSLWLMDVAPGVQTRAIGIAKGEPSAGQIA
jgi:hypothetical protein